MQMADPLRPARSEFLPWCTQRSALPSTRFARCKSPAGAHRGRLMQRRLAALAAARRLRRRRASAEPAGEPAAGACVLCVCL